MMTSTFWKHKKTDNVYVLIFNALNCTNAQDGQKMVLYRRHNTDINADHEYFVREVNEFKEKFTPMLPEET